nr:antitermination regulator [Pantoea cypripedii]
MQKQLMVVRGLRIALIGCHTRDENALLLQFQRLGIAGDSFSHFHPTIFDAPYDGMIFDSDNRALIQSMEQNSWPALAKIALLGMETPSRVKWVIDQNINGYLRKPVKAEGVLSTLILARHDFQRQKHLQDQLQQFEHRHQLRRFLLSAQLLLIKEFNFSEQSAYALLRQLATEQQKTVEEFCLIVLANPEAWIRHIKLLSL